MAENQHDTNYRDYLSLVDGLGIVGSIMLTLIKNIQMGQEDYRYIAFISYSQQDRKMARWLQRKIENYTIPQGIKNDWDEPGKKVRPVFLDQSDLDLGDLKNSLPKELDTSQYLIVICSPAAAASKWVNREIIHFNESNRSNRIIPFMIEGNENSSYPPALDKEILGANIAETREKSAVKIIAVLLGTRFDNLWKRHQRQRRKRIYRNIGLGLLLLAGVLFLGQYLRNLSAEKQLLEQKRKESEQSRSDAEKLRQTAVDEAIHEKAAYYFQNASRLIEANPAKAFLLFCEAYMLEPTKFNFSNLRQAYDRQTLMYKSIEDTTHAIGTMNLFSKTVTPAYGDIDEDDDFEKMVKISLKLCKIFTRRGNSIEVRDLGGNTIQVATIKGAIDDWQISEFANAIVFTTRDESGKDIQVYNLKTRKMKSLYRNASEYNPVLQQFFSETALDVKALRNGQTSLRCFPHSHSPYGVFYYASYLLGAQENEEKRIAILSLDGKGRDYLSQIRYNTGSDYLSIKSISPDGINVIAYFSWLQYPPVWMNYDARTRKSERLNTTQNNLSPTFTSFGWLEHQEENLLMAGADYPAITIYNAFGTEIQLLCEPKFGTVTQIQATANYIFASTSQGYILVWKNNKANWAYSKKIQLAENFAAIRASTGYIEDFRVNKDLLLFKDEWNSIKICHINDRVKLSSNVAVLRKQLQQMAMDKFTAKDSTDFGIVKR